MICTIGAVAFSRLLSSGWGGRVLSDSHPVTLLDKWVLRPIVIDSLRGSQILTDCVGGGDGGGGWRWGGWAIGF
jgi:hypothetical protein